MMNIKFSCFLAALCFAASLLLLPACLGQQEVDLPFGDINVLVLTDVHSWVGGHGNEPNHNADYGDVLSFYQRLHSHCKAHNMDLWFVVNGDWIDGQGISLNDDISYLTPILEKMPWDALNVGNHELYRTEVVHQFMRPAGFVETWGEKYLSSNVLYTKRQQPLGHRYRFLRGNNATVLTFGFLYNMDDHSEAVTVETVETVVEERWFVDVITNANSDPQGNYDAIMVLAHMDVRDALVTVVLDKIRSLVGPTMPVQFITGHTHYRGVHTMDAASVSFEAGRFLDTIGFVSFPKQKTLEESNNRNLQGDNDDEEGEGETPALLGPGGTEWLNVSDTNANASNIVAAVTVAPSPGETNAQTTASPTATTSAPSTSPQSNVTTALATSPVPTNAPTPKPADLFHHIFLDTNVANLQTLLGVPELATEDGASLSELIFRARSELGLLDLVGCPPQSYYLNRTLEEKDSLWKVFLEKVAPYQLLKTTSTTNPKRERIFLGGTGGLRYDITGEKLIKDDIIAVSPFNETIFSLGPNISGAVIRQLTEVLSANFVLSPPLSDIKNDTLYEIMAPEFGVSSILNGLTQIGYNGYVRQEESGHFTTDLWVSFVSDKWECKKSVIQEHVATSGSHTHSNGNTNHHSGGSLPSTSSGGHDKGVHNGAPFYDANEGEDKKRVVMASVGLACVVLLGSIYIWQLHRDWHEKYNQRQRLIMQLDAENDNELI